MDISEIALTSDDNGQFSNIYAWNYQTETLLKTFRGSSSVNHTLSLLGCDYILSAQKEQPLIHVWSIHGKEQIYMKMTCPGRVSALCITPDGLYCIAGINEKLLIWQVSTGNLLAVIAKHYQPISCIRTTDDGGYFISAGEDNLMHVWPLNRVLSEKVEIINGVHSAVSPLHTWGQHSLPVTDIHIGFGCLQSRVATCSLDRSCKLFDLVTGRLLLSIVFDVSLLSVVMDPAEYHLMAASTDGRIFRVNLFKRPQSLDHHYLEEKPCIFEGHSKSVNCLAVCENGSHLLSGSDDGTAKLWHIPSCQCIRTFSHKGPVTNVMFVPAFETFFATHPLKSNVCIGMFKRSLHRNMLHEASETGNTQSAKIFMRLSGNSKKPLYPCSLDKDQLTQEEDDHSKDWKSVANKLLETNRQIYNYTIQHILQNSL